MFGGASKGMQVGAGWGGASALINMLLPKAEALSKAFGAACQHVCLTASSMDQQAASPPQHSECTSPPHSCAPGANDAG